VQAKLGHLVGGACKNFRVQQEPKYGFFKVDLGVSKFTSQTL